MIKPLTSLRFFFAFIVFLSHLEWVPTVDKNFSGIYDNVLQEGFLGVSFFFILSGFILALNYKEKILDKKISFKDFWIARIARIYPLHLLTLLYSLPIFFTDLFKAPFFWISSFVANLFLLQSFVPDQDVYFGFNAVSWSISNELFYYLMFPVLLIVIYKIPKSIYLFLFLFLLIPIAIYFTPRNIQVFLYSVNPVIRVSDFILGMLLFKVYELKLFSRFFRTSCSATIAELSAILLFILFFSFHLQVPVGFRFATYYWLPMICIIYAFAHQTGFFSRLLSFKWLVFLGEISFSFYMFHALTMRYIKAVERRIDYTPNVYFFVLFIFIVIIGVSILSYYYLELPINRRIREKFRSKPKAKKEKALIEEFN